MTRADELRTLLDEHKPKDISFELFGKWLAVKDRHAEDFDYILLSEYIPILHRVVNTRCYVDPAREAIGRAIISRNKKLLKKGSVYAMNWVVEKESEYLNSEPVMLYKEWS